jgi:hypothetical protein
VSRRGEGTVHESGPSSGVHHPVRLATKTQVTLQKCSKHGGARRCKKCRDKGVDRQCYSTFKVCFAHAQEAGLVTKPVLTKPRFVQSVAEEGR